jgi:hypothetical protein
MNPFALLLDQTSALSAHTGPLSNLESRVVRSLSKAPRVAPPKDAALFDARLEAQSAAYEERARKRVFADDEACAEAA